MLWLRFILESGHSKLHMRQMHAAYRKESTAEQGQKRRLVNHQLRQLKGKCNTTTLEDHSYTATRDERSPKREFMETLLERRRCARTIQSAQWLSCLSQPVVTVVHVTATLSRTDSTHTRGSRSTLCLAPKQSHLIAQCQTLHLTWALHLHRARALFPLTLTQCSSDSPFSQLQPCADLRPHLSGSLAYSPSFTLCVRHGSVHHKDSETSSRLRAKPSRLGEKLAGDSVGQTWRPLALPHHRQRREAEEAADFFLHPIRQVFSLWSFFQEILFAGLGIRRPRLGLSRIRLSREPSSSELRPAALGDGGTEISRCGANWPFGRISITNEVLVCGDCGACIAACDAAEGILSRLSRRAHRRSTQAGGIGEKGQCAQPSSRSPMRTLSPIEPNIAKDVGVLAASGADVDWLGYLELQSGEVRRAWVMRVDEEFMQGSVFHGEKKLLLSPRFVHGRR